MHPESVHQAPALRQEAEPACEDRVVTTARAPADIVARLRALRGPWIGDGVNPPINANDLADEIEWLRSREAEFGDESEFTNKPIVLVWDRVFDGSGLEIGLWDRGTYWMPDGDGFKREGDTLGGMYAQFLSPIELAKLLEPSKTASGLPPKRSVE